MSVTTTDNPMTTSLLQVLTDYDIHHSGNPEHPAPAPAPNASFSSAATSNPPSWPTDHRRIPPYRPINRDRPEGDRPGGMNVPEHIFIYTMLNGVGINARLSTIWRSTGGKVNDQIFRYKVGGET